MKTEYPTPTMRTYERNGEIVAIAINPTWKHDINNHVDSQTRYYCLDKVWEPDSNVFVVSPEKLTQLMAQAEFLARKTA